MTLSTAWLLPHTRTQRTRRSRRHHDCGPHSSRRRTARDQRARAPLAWGLCCISSALLCGLSLDGAADRFLCVKRHAQVDALRGRGTAQLEAPLIGVDAARIQTNLNSKCAMCKWTASTQIAGMACYAVGRCRCLALVLRTHGVSSKVSASGARPVAWAQQTRWRRSTPQNHMSSARVAHEKSRKGADHVGPDMWSTQ